MAHAQSIELGGADFVKFWAGPYIQIVETQDPSQPKRSFEQERSKSFSVDRSVPAFGYTTKQYAAKIEIENLSNDSFEVRFVVYGPIEKVFVQTESLGKASGVEELGMYVPPRTLPQESFRYPSFVTNLRPGKNSIYLGEDAITPHFPLLIMPETKFQVFSFVENVVTHGLFACNGMLLLLSIVVLVFVRSYLALSFAFWMFFSILFSLFIAGALRPVIYIAFSDNLEVATKIEQLVYQRWIIWWGLMQFFAIVFGSLFLRVNILGRSWRSHVVQMGLVCSALLVLLPKKYDVFSVRSFTFPFLIVVFLFCIQSFELKKKYSRSAYWIFAGWCTYGISGMTMMLYYFGVIGPSFLTSWGLLIAGLGQSIALGSAIYWERKKAETEALTQIEKSFRELAVQEALLQDYGNQAELVDVAQQVAHDIRSPLAALSAAEEAIESLPKQYRDLVRFSVNGIHEIANDLLRKNGSVSMQESVFERSESVEVSDLLNALVREKEVQYRDAAGVELILESRQVTQPIFAKISRSLLRRMLSNIVNNSVESLNDRGSVWISYSVNGSNVEILVRDDGCGIPKENLGLIATRGATFGKNDGLGLGLYHARRTCEALGGALIIQSEVGVGTRVTVRIPVSSDSERRGRSAVLVDDDSLVRMTWEMSAKKSEVTLRSFRSYSDLLGALETIAFETPIYLDSDLGGEMRGEEIARILHERGFLKIYLATGAEVSRFRSLNFLSGVFGKEPPW